jgi:mRNA interferase MazF
MLKGEVWRVRLPTGVGHKQAGERPAVVVQNAPFIASLPTVVVIPFTGTLAAARFSGTLVVQPDRTNGLTVPSVALVFQVGAVDKQALLVRLGTLDPSTLGQLLSLLHQLTA